MVTTRRSRHEGENDNSPHLDSKQHATSGSDSDDDAPEEVSLATSRSRVTKELQIQRQAQQDAKNLKKSQRDEREKARRERREAEQRAAEEEAVAAEQGGEGDHANYHDNQDDEDRLPDDVLRALATKREHHRGERDEDREDGEEEDQRVLQRRIVSQQLRALHAKPNKRKQFGDGRTVCGGIVVKSLKSQLGSDRARGVSESRKFLESRLGRHARDHNGLGLKRGRKMY